METLGTKLLLTPMILLKSSWSNPSDTAHLYYWGLMFNNHSNCDNYQPTMSLSFSAHALRLGKSMLSWSNRLVKFVKHRMLTQKKNILIIGDEHSKIYAKLYPLIANHWEVVHIAESG